MKVTTSQEDDAPPDRTSHSASQWPINDNAGGQAPHLGLQVLYCETDVVLKVYVRICEVFWTVLLISTNHIHMIVQKWGLEFWHAIRLPSSSGFYFLSTDVYELWLVKWDRRERMTESQRYLSWSREASPVGPSGQGLPDGPSGAQLEGGSSSLMESWSLFHVQRINYTEALIIHPDSIQINHRSIAVFPQQFKPRWEKKEDFTLKNEIVNQPSLVKCYYCCKKCIYLL